jgi:hypothetical protein
MKIFYAACLALIAVTISCDYPERYKPFPAIRGVRVSGVELFLSADSIREQETLQARAYVILDSGRKKPAESVTWETMNEDIVSVDQGGVVTGLRPGSGTIRARVEAMNAIGSVEVLRRIDYSRIMINEVFYDATGSDDGKEFIELYNDNDYPCDISGMMVVDGSTASRAFIFPPGSEIGPASCAVIAQSADGFSSFFGKSSDYGNFSFSLNNSGETVMLMNSDGSIVDTVYIKGGTEEFRPPESWGPALLPAAAAGQSVYRLNYPAVTSGADWSSGPPTPGLQ